MNSQTARQRIMARLHAAGTDRMTDPPVPTLPEVHWDREEKISRLAELMAAIRTEVHMVEANAWRDKLMELTRTKGWRQLLYGPGSPIGSGVEKAWSEDAKDLPELVAYTEPVETFKDQLFQIDAGITGTLGGVAETGAVALWPTVNEPRLLSLVPHTHVAVIDADTIYNTLTEMMTAQHWGSQMPANALLISGPSKTSDIEFTLVFGVHGPKEMILLIRK